MAVYSVRFYDYNPAGNIPTGTGNTFTWSGPADAVGKAVVDDPEPGIQGTSLDDDNNGGESAQANVNILGTTSTNSNVDAELAWTVTDSVTGQTFNIVQFQVENGAANGFYTLSEIPLVPGRLYTVNDYDSNPDITAGDPAFNFADYVPPTQVVTGTNGNNNINASYGGDAQNDRVDDGFTGGVGGNDNIINALGGNDTIDAGLGNDSVDGGTGNDSIDGGTGNDTLLGGDGNDTINGNGDPDPVAQDEVLDWSAQGLDGTNVAAGFTQVTGDMQVGVSFSNDGNNNPTFIIETSDTAYVAGGEDYDANSNLYLYGNGDGSTSTTTIDFTAVTGTSVADEVSDVSFRINDIDFFSGNHRDSITITAIDADGNPVTMVLTAAGDDTTGGDAVNGYTITAGPALDGPGDANGSVLVTIAGPVQSISIAYANALNGTQAIYISDVHFTTIPDLSAGDADLIDGGAGADVIDGDAGADTIIGGAGNDTMTGGAGDDLFVISDGHGNDRITDFDTGDTDGDGSFNDQLDLSGLTVGGNPINAWDIVVSDDGFGNALLTFPNGQTLVLEGVTPAEMTGAQNLNAAGVPCFTEGTLIRTPKGEVPVETLEPGDMVETRDAGPQAILWTGRRILGPRELMAAPNARPVLIPQGLLGNHAPLLVSPQHGMVLGAAQGLDAEALVRAKHLAEAAGPVRVAHGKRRVSYHHLMFDRHQIVFANGAPSESFYPGPQTLKMYPPLVVAQIAALVPGLGPNPVETVYGPTARRFLKRREVLKRVDLRNAAPMLRLVG